MNSLWKLWQDQQKMLKRLEVVLGSHSLSSAARYELQQVQRRGKEIADDLAILLSGQKNPMGPAMEAYETLWSLEYPEMTETELRRKLGPPAATIEYD